MSSQFIQNFKTFYTPFEKAVRRFVYTDWFLALISAVVFIAWVTKCAPFGFVALITIAVVALLGANDILPFTVCIFSGALMIYSDNVADFLYLWPTFIPLGLAIIIFAVKNARNRHFTFGKMFFPQLAVAAALLLGGAGVIPSAHYLRELGNVLALGLGVLGVYTLFNQYTLRDDNRDYALYFARTLMYIGTVVALQLAVVIIKADVSPSLWHTTYWSTGWGNRNNISTYLVLTAPMCFYLSTRYRSSWLYYLIGIFQYVALIATFSRGGIIFGAIGGVFSLVFSIVKSQNKKRQLITVGVILVCALGAYFVLMDKINAAIESLIARGMGTSGRTELYLEAWTEFKAHPFLGVGMGFVGNHAGQLNVMNQYWFHSTLFQIIGSTGIVGILAYVYNYGTRLYILFKHISRSFNLFALAMLIGFEGYSMIDTGTFVPYPNMFLVITLTFMLELTNASPEKSGEPDAYNRTIKSWGAYALARQIKTDAYVREEKPNAQQEEVMPA